MAQFKNDFHQYVVGVAPGDWSEHWHEDDGSITVESSPPAGGLGNKALRILRSTNGRYVVSWDEPGTPSGDVELLAHLYYDDVEDKGTTYWGAIHGGGVENTEDAYLTTNAANNWKLQKFVAGASTNLEFTGDPTPHDTWFWARLGKSGDTLRGKTWLGTLGEEPDEWQAEVTDTDLTSGFVGVGGFFQSSTVYCDFFSVGTAGDPAPLLFDPEPHFAEAEYTLVARNSQTLAIEEHITTYTSVRWQHRLYGLGSFEISGIELGQSVLDWAVGEGVLQVMRDGVTEYVGIVDDVQFDDETGLGSIQGFDLRSFLGWRDIYPPVGEASDDRTGVASQIIRDYIIANLTTGASTARNINNQFSGPVLLVENVSIGTTVERIERYTNLLATAFEIAQEGEIFFLPSITAGDDYQIDINAFVDKTSTVRLTLPLSTALSMQAVNSWREYVNAIRTIWNAGNPTEVIIDTEDISALSPYRRETVITDSVRLSATLSFSDPTQWWTDFSEYPETSTVDDPGPPGWTRRWDVTNLAVNVRKSTLPTGTTGGAALRFFERTSSTGRMALSSDYPGIVSSPVEIYARCQFSQADFNTMNLIIHGGGSGGLNEDAYGLFGHGDPNVDGTEWSLASIVEGQGDAAQIEGTPAITINDWFHFRLRREGRLIKAKVWADGGTEPSTWVEFEDHSHDIGWMGVSRWPVAAGANLETTWFDWVGFDWTGGTAPSTMNDQTVTIGSVTYTFSHDMSIANNVRRELTADLMARNLAAAINDESAQEGILYGTGTTAHPDVTAEADGGRVIVISDGTNTVTLASDLINGEWDANELGQTIGLAGVILADSADRVRTYQVAVDQRSVRYRDDVELGDLVTVRSERLGLVDTRLVAGVDVAYTETNGEQISLALGLPAPGTFDVIEAQGTSIRRLKVQP